MARSLPDSAFLERMRTHTIHGVRELANDPRDRAHELVRHLYALTTYMSALVADPEGYDGPHLDRQIDTLNRQVVSGAFDALSHLAGLADFYISEIE